MVTLPSECQQTGSRMPCFKLLAYLFYRLFFKTTASCSVMFV